MTVTTTHTHSPRSQRWYQPTISPEHGVYVILAVSFLTGAAAAQQWTWVTTLALVCAFCGFQAEHPLVLQIKQRRSWKPRLLLWAGLYGGVAGAIALWLLGKSHSAIALGLIYSAVSLALMVDTALVWRRQQKSVVNELITFAAVCLSAPLAYTATTGTLSMGAIALWAINTLFFASAIFTVKLRKPNPPSIVASATFHAIATALVLVLGLAGWLGWMTAAAFGIGLLKFMLIRWQKDWYCTTKIQHVALIETASSVLFLGMVSESLLPHLGLSI